MFKLKPKKSFFLEMNDREHGVLSEALRVTGCGDEETWTKNSLVHTVGEALLKYADMDFKPDVYGRDGEDMDMEPKEFYMTLIKFNNFVNKLEDGTQVQVFQF